MKSLLAHVGPLMTTALALVGDPEVFDALINKASFICRQLNLVRVSKLLTLNLFRLEQPTARRASSEHLSSSH